MFDILFRPQCVNSLWSRVTRGQHLHPCWLIIISEVLWHSPEGNFTWNAENICPWYMCISLKIAKLRLRPHLSGANELTRWGRVTHKCVSKIVITGSDNGLLRDRRQAIIWTDAEILLIGPLINFSEILIEINIFSFKKIHLKMLSVKWRPFCLSLNMLSYDLLVYIYHAHCWWFMH